MDWNKLLSQYEDLIRSGRSSEVLHGLRQLAIKQIPRSLAWRFAELTRRTNLSDLGLRILKPYILSDVSSLTPSQEETIVYSALLAKIGAVDEALMRLTPMSPESPRAALFMAYAHISQWNYRKAAPLLEEISRGEALDAYQTSVAQVNLAACYVNLAHWSKAEVLLGQLSQKCKLNNWSLLLANVYELSSLLLIETAQNAKDFEMARVQIDQIVNQLMSSATPQQNLFLSKWKAILQLIQLGPNARTLQALEQVYQQAQLFKHWETLRDCDFYRAVYTKDENLAIYLLYGTPFESFKKKIWRHFHGLKLPGEFIWRMNKEQECAAESSWDLYSGKTGDNSFVLKPQSVSHRLFTTLTLDFYRPHMLASIFSKIHPGEFYNPMTTPGRMIKSIQRLRVDLQSHSTGIELKGENGVYWLSGVSEKPGAVLLRKDRAIKFKNLKFDSQVSKLLLLKSYWPYQNFSAKQAAELLKISTRSVNSLLSWAIGEGRLKAQGASRNLRYFFVSQ